MQTSFVATSTVEEQLHEVSKVFHKGKLPQILKAVHEVCLLSSPKHCQSQLNEPR
jgi:hypothetical protein